MIKHCLGTSFQLFCYLQDPDSILTKAGKVLEKYGWWSQGYPKTNAGDLSMTVTFKKCYDILEKVPINFR